MNDDDDVECLNEYKLDYKHLKTQRNTHPSI